MTLIRGDTVPARPLFAAALAALPVVIVLALYIPSLRSAYRIDDLAWLSLPNTLHNGRSLWWALFSPQSQGTIRPLGERVWFLLASSWFGLNPFPFHLFALVTQIANILLVIAVGRRLLGSFTGAALAAVLWSINDSLVEPIVWASAFNEILCTFWFLLAFYALLRWIDSHQLVWLAVHVSAVLLGFATLELMVTFSPIAAVYIALFARKHWKVLLPSTAIAVAFVMVHLCAVRIPQTGPYRLTFGPAIITDFVHYWAAVLGPGEFARIFQASPLLMRLATILMSASLLVWLVAALRRQQFIPLFGLLWFLIGFAPTLPLHNHYTAYYAFLPLMGLALLAGDAVVHLRSWRGRSVALACLALYAFCHIPSTRFARDWYSERSRDVERREARLASAVQLIRRTQPDGAVFLDRLDTEQFWWGLCYGELIRRGYTGLHVMPDAALTFPPREWCQDPNVLLSRDESDRLLRTGVAHRFDVTTPTPGPTPVRAP